MARSTSASMRVMIVDDSSTMRAMLHELLADHSAFKVVGMAKSGEEALTVIASSLPNIVIIDLCMPYIDGSRLLAMLHDYPAMVKVVLSSSGSASAAVQRKLFELGASAFFDKSVVAKDPEAFRNKLLRIVEGGRGSAGGSLSRPANAANVIFAADRFPVPHDEQARLTRLASLNVANGVIDPSLDIVARHVARSVSYPMVVMSVIDADTLWMKAVVGIDRQRCSREQSICAHALCQDGPLTVGDTFAHPTFRTLPMVAGEPYIRAYVGVPLVSKDNIKLGILCALDILPRQPSGVELAALADAARLMTEFLERPMRDGRRVA